MARFERSGPLRGTLLAPPDKSISHRAALIAAMGEGSTRIGRYLDAADTRSTLAAVAALGAGVEIEAGPEVGTLEVAIEGVGLRGIGASAGVDVGNAGTLIRLLSGWLAGQEGHTFELDGDESIRRRPMGRIVDPLTLMGARIEANDGRPPLTITGGRLEGIDYRLPVASAQVKSCLLFAGLLAEGETVVREPDRSRDHTERMLRAAGVELRSEPRTALPTVLAPETITVRRSDRIALGDLRVPGDISSAAFHLVAGVLVPGSAVRIEGVGLNPTRVGLLGILQRMGADLEVSETGHQAGEPVGDVVCRHSGLTGTRVSAAEVPLAIDELPLVALLGCFAAGETVVSGAEELRHKESDRIATVVEGLRRLGADIEARPDGFAVAGGDRLEGGAIDAAGDHRIAMLGAIAGLASVSGVEVGGFEAAGVSYPRFGDDLADLATAG